MMHTLTATQVHNILQFLSRAQLSGAEVEAFVDCVMALRKLLDPAPADLPGAPPKTAVDEQ